jgi:hypothetical protein
MKLTLIIFVIHFVAIMCYANTETPNLKIQKLLNAIEQVESGGNVNAVGDNSKSLGSLQIQYAYWKDSKVPGNYQMVKNKQYAEKVVIAYWQRYCPNALKNNDFETLARTHNSGPLGYKKIKATQKYWEKVKKQLNK